MLIPNLFGLANDQWLVHSPSSHSIHLKNVLCIFHTRKLYRSPNINTHKGGEVYTKNCSPAAGNPQDYNFSLTKQLFHLRQVRFEELEGLVNWCRRRHIYPCFFQQLDAAI